MNGADPFGLWSSCETFHYYWASQDGTADNGIITVTGVVTTTTLRTEGGPGNSNSGSGGGNANYRAAPSNNPIKNWLCNAGNSLASGSESLGDASGKLELIGLGAAGVGVLTAQSEVVGSGIVLSATGGVGNIGAGAHQLGAGLLQFFGGGGFSNAGYAALSLATGFTLARGYYGACR